MNILNAIMTSKHYSTLQNLFSTLHDIFHKAIKNISNHRLKYLYGIIQVFLCRFGSLQITKISKYYYRLSKLIQHNVYFILNFAAIIKQEKNNENCMAACTNN